MPTHYGGELPTISGSMDQGETVGAEGCQVAGCMVGKGKVE